MKSTIYSAIVIVALVIVSNSNLSGEIQDVDQAVQDTPPAVVQDAPPAVVQDAPPAATQEKPAAVVQDPEPAQDEAPPEPPQPDDAPAAVDTQESPSDAPAAANVQEPPVVEAPMPEMYVPESVLQGPPMMMPAAPACGSCGCQPCCCAPCSPCPVPTTLCLVDPCCGCSYEVCVNVPACCVGQQPTVSWRNGCFGRKIATLCWSCCDKQVKVTVTRRGNVRVRG